MYYFYMKNKTLRDVEFTEKRAQIRFSHFSTTFFAFDSWILPIPSLLAPTEIIVPQLLCLSPQSPYIILYH